VFEHIEFIDQGENLGAVVCSACHTKTVLDHFTEGDPGMKWWFGLDDLMQGKRIDQVETSLPCCGQPVPFTSLEFDWPAGFARFELSVQPHV
jgi:hypothetical protein